MNLDSQGQQEDPEPAALATATPEEPPPSKPTKIGSGLGGPNQLSCNLVQAATLNKMIPKGFKLDLHERVKHSHHSQPHSAVSQKLAKLV